MYHQFNIQQFYVLPTQTLFMCFVCIWEETAIISLYNFNWLIFVTEKECVYCAVRTECLHVLMKFRLRELMFQRYSLSADSVYSAMPYSKTYKGQNLLPDESNKTDIVKYLLLHLCY